ncbi:MAG TPA: hypothetical protein VF281_00275 [Candidatus Saccharimonadales bacterium]
MILLTHILIAISSIIYTSPLLVHPSRTKLRTSYILIAATLASGTYLTILNPVHMLQTCTTGLVYVVIVSAGVFIARRQLIKREADTISTNI